MMKFKNKTKQKLKSKLYPIMLYATFGQVPEWIVEKLWKFYIRFLEIFFMITTSITITLTFTWFIPIFLKKGYELSIVILLCLILLQIRYGTTTVKFEENEEK